MTFNLLATESLRSQRRVLEGSSGHIMHEHQLLSQSIRPNRTGLTLLSLYSSPQSPSAPASPTYHISKLQARVRSGDEYTNVAYCLEV
jgi:hypothetical protein